MTVLVGANGCGKSTLLSTLARLLQPLGGNAVLDGKAIHSQPTKAVARQLDPPAVSAASRRVNRI